MIVRSRVVEGHECKSGKVDDRTVEMEIAWEDGRNKGKRAESSKCDETDIFSCW